MTGKISQKSLNHLNHCQPVRFGTLHSIWILGYIGDVWRLGVPRATVGGIGKLSSNTLLSVILGNSTWLTISSNTGRNRCAALTCILFYPVTRLTRLSYTRLCLPLTYQSIYLSLRTSVCLTNLICLINISNIKHEFLCVGLFVLPSVCLFAWLQYLSVHLYYLSPSTTSSFYVPRFNIILSPSFSSFFAILHPRSQNKIGCSERADSEAKRIANCF